MMCSYQDLLNIKIKRIYILFIICSFFILFLIFYNREFYSVKSLDAVSDGKYLSVYTQFNDSMCFEKINFIKIDKESYIIKDVFYGDVLNNNNILFQEIKILLDVSYDKNKVVKLRLFYDQEKLIDKIIKLVKE